MPKVHIIPLNDGEIAELLRRGVVLTLQFGPSGVWMEWEEGTPVPEQVEALARLRGVGLECADGAAI